MIETENITFWEQQVGNAQLSIDSGLAAGKPGVADQLLHTKNKYTALLTAAGVEVDEKALVEDAKARALAAAENREIKYEAIIATGPGPADDPGIEGAAEAGRALTNQLVTKLGGKGNNGQGNNP